MAANNTASQRAAALSRDALDLIHRHDVAPTPSNYELWYAYVSQENSALVEAIDTLIATEKAGNEQELQRLYARFFGASAREALAEINVNLSQEIAKLGKTLERSGDDTKEYGRTLKAAGDALSGNDIGPKLKDIVAAVTAATQAMETRNKALEQQLSSSMSEVGALRGRMETLRKESLSDGLTGLANRRCFDERIEQAAEAARTGRDLCLIMGDIDHFKRFNDTWGHATGDQVLRLVAQCFKSNVRESDTAARYGGEEMAAVLPGMKLDDAIQLAERIRADVASKKIVKRSTGESLGSITLSLGVAAFNTQETVADFISRADQCLYAGKHAGRNRVVSERDRPGLPGPVSQKQRRSEARDMLRRSPESWGFEEIVMSLKSGNNLPLRSAIDLNRFRKFARWLAIAEPLGAECRMPIGLVGSGFYEFFGRDLTHSDYLELVQPAIRDAAHQSALLMVNHCCGLWQKTPLLVPGMGTPATVEFTAFPIVDDKSQARQVLLFVHHTYSDLSGYPRAVEILTAEDWTWIDLGNGVPEVVGAAA